jgi:hypothetical protein
MQKKKQKNSVSKLLLTMATAILILFIGVGCPTSGDDDDDNEGGGGPTIPPEKPRIVKNQSGFELINVELATVTNDQANNEANQSAVVALEYEGDGAVTYNVYWGEDSGRPTVPGLTGEKGPVSFARNLKPETTYYIWVEAVNPLGTAVSDPITSTTGQKGPQASGGKERAHFPQDLQAVPGNGSLTVSWNLVDRVGWYEVYYAPKGAIKHLDAYTGIEFKYDTTKTLRPGAIDVSGGQTLTSEQIGYTGRGVEGHTRPLYPYMSPLAPNSGYEGYYVRDGQNRVDGDTRPIIGTDGEYLSGGVFYKVWEAYDKGIQDPYKPLDPAFASAIPWDGERTGTPGMPVKFFGTSTTITGLENGKEYEVWIRSPNANGERGYGYVLGIPGTGNILPSPSNVQVTTPTDSARNLTITWNTVSGADGYRIYTSKFDYTPSVTTKFGFVDEGTSYTVEGLDSDTTYYVWVVAEKSGLPGAFGQPVTGKTGKVVAPTVGHVGDKFIAGSTTQKVKTAVYIEVNDRNPLNAGSYILDDGTYLFDYVILFAANIRDRTCTGTADGGCTETGVHVHFNENVRYILENRTKYIVPLQQKGIKVILGLLGDHDGISFGSMNDTQRTTFIADVKKDVEFYQLDGVDFDDEWGSKEDWKGWGNGLEVGATGKTYDIVSPQSVWTYPTSSWGWPTSVTVYRDPSKGIEPGNGITTAPSAADMTKMWRESGESYYKTIKAARDVLGPDKIVTLYEYNTGRYVTAQGLDNGTATKAALEGAIDYALQPWYNQYIGDSANGLSRNIYSPFGMDLSGKAYAAQNGAPNPPIVLNGNDQATNTIYDFATRYKQAADNGDPYGILYFYALEESSNQLKRVSTDARATVTKEAYISMMSKIVFGKDVVLTADRGDYRKDW